jgi:Flp pilus assembly protein TadG
MRRLRSLLRDDTGTTLVETTLVFPMVMLLTFGLVEAGHAMWEYHTVEKATNVGARYVVTRGPLVASLSDGSHDCFVTNPSTVAIGTSCGDASIPAGSPITCAPLTNGCDSTVRAAMLSQMQQIAPFITDANVRVVLRQSKMGFIGRGKAIPTVTVQTTGLTYSWILLGALTGGPGTITMPSFATTLTAEDLQEGPGS